MDFSKKSYCKTQINLPFPYPMLNLHNDNNKIKWPFKEEGFLLTCGELIESKKLILINDIPSIVALNKMGFFGIHSTRELLSQQQKQSSQEENNSKHRFTVGFYSLEPFDLPPALNVFKNDMNKPLEKIDPSPKTSPEGLKLSLEEAYFLSYVFGMLKISKNFTSSSSTEYYNLDELWKCFCQTTNPNDSLVFASKFAAYYYFRSIGFVVKNGFKFGVDYLLYEDGPPFNHSLYSVLVQTKIESKDDNKETELNFNEISALTRISKNSCKEFILCTVVIPKDLSMNDQIILSKGPKCIKNFQINLVKIDRFNLNDKFI